MRLRKNRLKDISICKRVTGRDSEGATYEEYNEPNTVQAEVWPGEGKVQAAQYGERLPYIRNIRLKDIYTKYVDEDGLVHYRIKDIDITEQDGLCIEMVEKPDYKIRSIKPYRFLTIEAEHI